MYTLNPSVGSTAHPEQQQFLLLVEQLRQLERAWDLSTGGMCGLTGSWRFGVLAPPFHKMIARALESFQV